jgi:hypothetical protein
MADVFSADPDLIAGGQYPQPHSNACFPLGGDGVIQNLRVQQVDGNRRAVLLHGIAASGSGKPYILLDVPGIWGTDINLHHFAATAFTTVFVMLMAVWAV